MPFASSGKTRGFGGDVPAGGGPEFGTQRSHVASIPESSDAIDLGARLRLDHQPPGNLATSSAAMLKRKPKTPASVAMIYMSKFLFLDSKVA